MDESDTLGIGESDDINLPLDEIIQRKAHRERPGAPRHFRRGPPRRYAPPRGPTSRRIQQETPFRVSYGTGAFHRDVPVGESWPQYEEGVRFQSPAAQMEVTPTEYWQVYPQPPPPPQPGVNVQEFSTPHKGAPIRGGIRKPVLDRRRQGGRGRRPYRRNQPPPDLHLQMEKPESKEETCTMTFEKGNAVIKFNDIEILKVNAQGDMILTTEGHQDGRFLKALNDVLGLINVEILADASKPESWKVKDGYVLFRYYDGIGVKGRGEMSKSRAETIKKAFEQPNPKALEATLASNLAARRLGLAFDPVSTAVGPGGHPVPPGSSIRITQDQQLTRTSNYSISFVDQNKEQQSETSFHTSSFHPEGHQSMNRGSMYHPY